MNRRTFLAMRSVPSASAIHRSNNEYSKEYSSPTQGNIETEFHAEWNDIELGLPRSTKPQAELHSGLEPYTQPLTLKQVLHLLRRSGFAGSYTDAQQFVGKTAQEVCDRLLGTGNEPLPEPPGVWVQEMTENPERADNDTRNQIISTWNSQVRNLQSWWINLMLAERFPVREKLTLFWSGHFTSEFEFDDMHNPPQLLYRQNQTLRSFALGDVRRLTEEITLDGAMLNYLGGTLNSKGAPNENYARELFELFTTGLGHYTEGDIKEAARVLTGWRCSRFNDEPRPNGSYNTYFMPEAHDTEAKRVLGIIIPARERDANTEFLVRQGEVRRLVEIIFQERSSEAARFISTKLYHFFVYATPQRNANTVIGQMAEILQRNAFHIRPLLYALFSSAHFFDESNIGVQIKAPAELIVSLARQLGVNAVNVLPAMTSLEQTLFDPPNVAGWEGYRTWISTTTYPLRVQYALSLVQAMSNEAAATFARQFEGADNVQTLIRAITEFLLPAAISQERLQSYTATLLQGAPDYEWSSILRDTNATGVRIKALLARLIKAPDMQLQ